MKAFWKRNLSGFEPADDNAELILKRYKFGDLAEGEFKKSRNIKFHRKFFKVIELTFQNQELTDNKEDFREAVTIEAGYWHWQKQLDGSESKRADSISFTKMDDITFGELYNSVFNVCLKILGCKSEELEMELLKFD